ncbi:MAG: Ribosomal protein [Planctomycetota bacterium]|jgi:large subunit ribosomal protein L29
MKIQEIRGKTDFELANEAKKLGRELFDMRFRAPTQGLQNSAQLTQTRRLLARIHTVLQERKLGLRGQSKR